MTTIETTREAMPDEVGDLFGDEETDELFGEAPMSEVLREAWGWWESRDWDSDGVERLATTIAISWLPRFETQRELELNLVFELTQLAHDPDYAPQVWRQVPAPDPMAWVMMARWYVATFAVLNPVLDDLCDIAGDYVGSRGEPNSQWKEIMEIVDRS